MVCLYGHWLWELPPLSIITSFSLSLSLSLFLSDLTHFSKPDNGNVAYNAEDIKAADQPNNPTFYPNMFIGDFSLPLSLSSLWKKKVDVLPPDVRHQLEMMQKMEEIKELNAAHKVKTRSATSERPKPASKKRRRKSAEVDSSEEDSMSSSHGSPSSSSASPPPAPRAARNKGSGGGSGGGGGSGDPATSTQVSDYENQIHNDQWPLDCIKCSVLIGNLDNFNIHMNDHWSDDKCCPVCGLLINSKRFNFKQHLKIHTGEKPFVCQVCSRSFRQKAHMVKHLTTHRTGAGGAAEVAV